MVTCADCGHVNPPGQKFCGDCGAALAAPHLLPLREQLEQMAREQILFALLHEPEPAYRFHHALTHETVYSSMLQRRRKGVHLSTAHVLEQQATLRGQELDSMLAFHFEQGEEWPAAAQYATRAGDAARQKYAVPEALLWYERALTLLDRLPEPPAALLCQATLGWIELALKTSGYEEQLMRLGRAERAAHTLNDPRLLARVLHWITNAHFAQGFNSRAAPAMFELYELGAAAGDERLSIVPGYYIALFMVDRDPRAALAQLDQVIELARKYENPDIEAHALATKGFAHARLGEFELARAEVEQALRFVRTLDSPVKEADIHNLAGYAYFDMGDIERSLDLATYGAQKAKSANAVECASAGLMCVGMNYLERQNPLAAQNAFAEVVRLADTAGAKEFLNFGQGGLASAQFLHGNADAVGILEKAVANAQSLGDEYTAAWFALTLATIYVRGTDPARAKVLLDDVLAYYRRNTMRPYLVRAMPTLIELYKTTGRMTEADATERELEALRTELASAP